MKIVTKEQFLQEKKEQKIQTETSLVLHETVLQIIQDVQQRGDEALFAYTKKFDQVDLKDLQVSVEELNEVDELVSEEFKRAIQLAYENIYTYHEKQQEKSWFYETESGSLLGQKVTPIENIGIYVPGGTAAYPSSVLMNAVPAKIAGVSNIYMVTPPTKDGKINPYILYAAKVAGVDTIFKVGGAQSIAALAYGTETIPKVGKIVGPGNAYVAYAKKLVFGDVAIDMIAGPSEICVVADDSTNPRYAAADLLSQAEHDELAVALCVTTSKTFAEKVQTEVKQQTQTLERREIVEKSLENFGRIILVETEAEAFELVNEIAPEHLQLMIEKASDKVALVKNAGAIFIGPYSPEALGDYVAGPNHTLPTSGTAIFSSPLGVYDFLKRSSIIHYTEDALKDVAKEIMTIANAEGLTAHAKAIEKRLEE